MNLTIKGLKTWETHEGGGFQFNLYSGSKKVAFVHNDGNGGCLAYQWFDDKARESIFDFVRTLPDWEAHGISGKMTVDIYMEELVCEYETSKLLARLRKKAIPFRLISDGKYTVRSVNTTDAEKAKSVLEKQYPNNYILI